jgi:hypothetical protein
MILYNFEIFASDAHTIFIIITFKHNVLYIYLIHSLIFFFNQI